mmetsp:Transcript_124320/g.215494  ORF Transcript_124320/g.215494 Transcript_124320/m.215494 type:complete len:365 (-) Transcript_124320:270-1364(-)
MNTEVDCQHEDYVHDIAFDFYGRRVATASSDKKIKIWDKDASGNWNSSPTYEWKKHSGSVRKLAWSHPAFGSLLASASADKYVYIWRETQMGKLGKPHTEWKEVFHSMDHRAAVVDLGFPPRRHGLRLATACHDGFIRIYECTGETPPKERGVEHQSHGRRIPEERKERWELRDSFEAGVPRDGTTSASSNGRQESLYAKSQKAIAVTCLSWNMSQSDATPSMVVGCADGSVRIWSCINQKWEPICDLACGADGNHGGAEVHSVSWANAMGRSSHLIASCGDMPKGRILISRIRRVGETGFERLEAVQVDTSNERAVWKVNWNITGTVLASSGDDGQVRLWKKGPNGDWESNIVHQTYVAIDPL